MKRKMMLRNSINKRWERRPQLYKGRLYYIKRTLQFAAFGFVMLLVASGWLYFKRSSTMNIKNVNVLGQLEHLSADDLVRIAGIHETDKLFEIDLDRISGNIHRHPWVRDVSLRREFPDTLQIHVREREARAILFVNDFYLVDDRGAVFMKMEASDFQDLPVLTGFSELFVKKYPALSKKYLLAVLDFLSVTEGVDFYKKFEISEIKFDAVFGFTVYTKTGQFEIYYGRDNIQQKHEKLNSFAGSTSFVVEKILRLDLNAREKIVARIL